MLEDRIQKSVTIEHEIDKRQKAIKIQELELAMQKLFRIYETNEWFSKKK